jgi:hypothetical protein
MRDGSHAVFLRCILRIAGRKLVNFTVMDLVSDPGICHFPLICHLMLIWYLMACTMGEKQKGDEEKCLKKAEKYQKWIIFGERL